MLMPKKQPLGRKHKAGTGNNKKATATRIISKTKVSTSAEINVKSATRQVMRSMEEAVERAAALKMLFDPIPCFAFDIGCCDYEDCEDKTPWACCAPRSEMLKTWPTSQGANGVRYTRSQRIAYHAQHARGGTLATFLNDSLRCCSVQRREREAEERAEAYKQAYLLAMASLP